MRPGVQCLDLYSWAHSNKLNSTVSDAKSVEKAGLTRSNDPKLDRWVFYNS